MTNLQQFCTVGDGRSFLNQPWTHNGWQIGCNGLYLVATPHSVPGMPETPDVPEGALKLLCGILSFNFDETVLIDASKLVLPDATICFECGAIGNVSQYPCSDCDGAGDIQHGHHRYECKHCNSSGRLFSRVTMTGPGVKQVTCTECVGTGYGSYQDVIDIGDVSFSTCLVRRLQSLPDLVFSVDAEARKANFRFFGGLGILIGRSK